MKFIGIIPARYGSTRFPGKPLAVIGGKTMIQRVVEQARKAASLSEVLVATDDRRIADHVLAFGGKAVITSPSHPSGTDRCFEALGQYDKNAYDAVVNIQGDEPFIEPSQIDLVCSCFKTAHVQIATLVKKISLEQELLDANTPKVVLDNAGRAIYFSRSPIPFLRGKSTAEWPAQHTYYRHIGIYAYRCDVLEEITALKPSPLEIAESLEQLRWLEHGYRIHTAVTEHGSRAVDSPADLENLPLT